ncbi:hypothetical protein [Streptomyces sp. B22F1]|uniref:hypothetical protein n=1 Tax=Streptomyces sp. B22F1 TaxID=3153566 RepID=UPI00325D64DA
MSEREYFAQFAKRTGMFIGHTSLTGVTAFMVGCDQAAQRRGGPGLDGWREWLMKNVQVSGNLVWEAQIRQVALPGWEGGWELTPEQEAHVLKVLFELFRQVPGRPGHRFRVVRRLPLPRGAGEVGPYPWGVVPGTYFTRDQLDRASHRR